MSSSVMECIPWATAPGNLAVNPFSFISLLHFPFWWSTGPKKNDVLQHSESKKFQSVLSQSTIILLKIIYIKIIFDGRHLCWLTCYSKGELNDQKNQSKSWSRHLADCSVLLLICCQTWEQVWNIVTFWGFLYWSIESIEQTSYLLHINKEERSEQLFMKKGGYE